MIRSIREKIRTLLFGKDPEEVLTELHERLEDFKFDIRMRKKNIERKMKRDIKNGRLPSAPWLATWKMSKIMYDTVDGAVATIDNALEMMQFNKTVKDIMKEANTEEALKALEKILNGVASMKGTLNSFLKMQEKMVNFVSNFNDVFSTRLEDLSSITTEVADEAIENIGAEFLAELQITDPTLINNLPPEIRAKIKSKNVS
ncbi:MAG: hypothetical protein J7L07_03060 [Candidatus Odinarchaeota archaeon]|nr:hypothetical protein [Candidatus Odinarchaeota archaeon]